MKRAQVSIHGRTSSAKRPEGGSLASLDAADWLSLAAAPVFAFMALLSAVDGDSAANLLCSAAHDASPLSGMVTMYVLMSVFHAGSWLKLAPAARRVVISTMRTSDCRSQMSATGLEADVPNDSRERPR